ncbi:hypothetical protein IW152_004830 [Coemansia sp. BCRC 34962]|nr:hypothetical protein IW152_004830 [Coemansia sp. BCRC 34962]
MTLPSPQQLTDEVRSKCTCGQARAADCHLRASGVIIVDQLGRIEFADHEAIDVLRGPAEEWNEDGGTPLSLRDDSYSGQLSDYWRFIECFTVSDKMADGKDSEASHHYLVVERTEDKVVNWIQLCVHYSPAEDGRELYVWSVRDISGSARCLEMSRLATSDDYTLSLEDDGFPHTPLLTQAPTDCHPTQSRARDELAELLEAAAASECFAVLHLTGFGAVDSVFPRRLLGWGEADLLDRSFIGLLNPDDRIFFCRALRRCHHDGIPQRLILKVASALAGDTKDAHLPEAHIYADCDVTVLMPEAMQQPVLVVRANDPAMPKQLSLCMLRAAATAATTMRRRQVVHRVRFDGAMLPPTAASAAGILLANANSVPPHLPPPSPSPSATFTEGSLPDIASPTAAGHVLAGKGRVGVPEKTAWTPGLAQAERMTSSSTPLGSAGEMDTLSMASTCTNASIGDAPMTTDLAKRAGTTLSIHMGDIFAFSPSKPPSLAAASTLCEHSPGAVDSTFASIFERVSIGAYRPSF